MKEIVLHDRGIVPILADLDKLFVVRVVFYSGGSNSYYICRYIPNPSKKSWMFIERHFPTKYGEQIVEEKTIQEACQTLMDITSSSYIISLWEFESEDEFKQAVQSGVF